MGVTKRLHIMAYRPELEADSSTSVSWDAEYIDANLYDVINDARMKYPEHRITLYFESGTVRSYVPMDKEEQHVQQMRQGDKPNMRFYDMKSKLIYEIKVVGDVWLRVTTEEFNAWTGLKRILSEEDRRDGKE